MCPPWQDKFPLPLSQYHPIPHRNLPSTEATAFSGLWLWMPSPLCPLPTQCPKHEENSLTIYWTHRSTGGMGNEDDIVLSHEGATARHMLSTVAFDTGGPFNTCHLAPVRATTKFSGGIHWLRRDQKGVQETADYRDWACKVGLGHATHQPSRAGLCGPEL